eukprot:TRINITY_DN4101_c0_g1_i1.p1 TRINITY_DN4101_c0_g1~~TRINITY_DN4101_c0_g1_i1.p1  ORF type:complete len:203 (+),score=66.27 TRINITY_DN4101_c0_g1_i1:13-621(+)
MSTTIETQPTIPADKPFYDAVNEKWLEETEFLPDYPSVSNFIILHEKSQKDQLSLLNKIVEKFNADPESLSQDERNIAVAFNTRLESLEKMYSEENVQDWSSIEFGLDFIQKNLPTDGDWASTLAAYATNALSMGFFFPLSFDKGQDLKDAKNVKADLSVFGNCLPGREYYLEKNFEKEREAFKQHVSFIIDCHCFSSSSFF